MRPSFLTLTTLGAALLAAAGGLLTESATHKEARAADRAAQRKQERAAAATERGFEPVEGLRAPPATAQVRLLRATRRFRLAFEPPLSGDVAPVAQATALADTLVGVLEQYPAGFLERAGLMEVVLCEGLREGSSPIPSLPNVGGALLIDIGVGEAFLPRLVHHEIFHFVDFADDGIVRDDPEWRALNEDWYAYATGGRFMRDPAAARLGSGGPGFLTRYATSAVEEDKAELFSFLMAAPEALPGRVQQDPFLQKKVATLAKRLDAFHEVPWRLPTVDLLESSSRPDRRAEPLAPPH